MSALIEPLIKIVMHRYWRWTRGMTLGAQGMVIGADNSVLLIRHGYRPGWHFPGGGVERRETIADALERELMEEAGIVPKGVPELFGFYSQEHNFRGDHIALFVVRDWEQPVVPKSNFEVAEQAFFAPDALPSEIHESTRARIREVLFGEPRSAIW